eukprot:1140682-Rhodomonas_salina.1
MQLDFCTGLRELEFLHLWVVGNITVSATALALQYPTYAYDRYKRFHDDSELMQFYLKPDRTLTTTRCLISEGTLVV